ncbi:TrmB family transcriptional regulator [Natrarchaeobius chitinivorans]|uniref:TrmB family transcriptional regulator n=1 Tax=Natrarchaeobius chitinivorans TaxID=1679083 RepID=A0A3N6P2G2_NATCH|nr:helix-turn-helix domain-containing protein [Natrarchaeobius chitinivorans]RQG91779.1 TrmB family transcriptional regulator [Natrarchaeobius chitinivorans]
MLQQLGLKEYEAKCFVALSRMPKGTAKEISETSEVPRTRVYDAIRVLETKGLVEIQHSNPQQFWAVPIDEGAETLRQEYESRTKTLIEAVEGINPVPAGDDEEVSHEVWALTGQTAIATRTQQFIDGAGEEIMFVVGREEVLTKELVTHLQAAQETGITVVVGTVSEHLRETVQEALPDAHVFVSELEWLKNNPTDSTDDTTISRLILIDRNTILVSSVHEGASNAAETERAVFGRGFTNGLVVIARRLMATGLETGADPKLFEGD